MPETDSPGRTPNVERFPDLPSDLFSKNRINGAILDQHQGFHRGPVRRRKGYTLIAFSWLASAMDALMILGVGMIFLAGFFLVNKFYGVPIFSGLLRDSQFVGCILFLVLCSYMIMLRAVLGFTLGEWACSIRVGTSHERLSVYYPLKVVGRTVILLLTGVFTLPLLSLCFGKDLAGVITGLRLNSLI